ncbi:MAG: hypothetical protein IR153_05395 [Flavobacterium sp.]|nr:hypothetical protein [Flavobacterium sp.]
MEDSDFFSAAEALAIQHPDDALAQALLDCLKAEPRDPEKCRSLASQVILKLIDVKPK